MPHFIKILSHKSRIFLPHIYCTFSDFYRTFAAHFGLLYQCGTALFGLKNRTKSPPLVQDPIFEDQDKIWGKSYPFELVVFS